jgi:hypothetical protein
MICGKKSATAAIGEDQRTLKTEIEKLFQVKRSPTKENFYKALQKSSLDAIDSIFHTSANSGSVICSPE